jgi:hypothetical protein
MGHLSKPWGMAFSGGTRAVSLPNGSVNWRVNKRCFWTFAGKAMDWLFDIAKPCAIPDDDP